MRYYTNIKVEMIAGSDTEALQTAIEIKKDLVKQIAYVDSAHINSVTCQDGFFTKDLKVDDVH